MNKKNIISFLIFLDGSKGSYCHLSTDLSRYTTFLKKYFLYYEIILIVSPKNKSMDLKRCVCEFQKIRVVELAMHCDKETAYYAGMHTAIGDAVFTIDITAVPDDALLLALDSVLSQKTDIAVLSKAKNVVHSQMACYSRKAIHFLLLQQYVRVRLSHQRAQLGLPIKRIPISISSKRTISFNLKKQDGRMPFIIENEWFSDNVLQQPVEKNVVVEVTSHSI